jgi:hypothetical protein
MRGPSRVVARATLRFIDAAAAVHRTQGLRGFYAGVLPNIMQVGCGCFAHRCKLCVLKPGPVDACTSSLRGMLCLAQQQHDVVTGFCTGATQRRSQLLCV